MPKLTINGLDYFVQVQGEGVPLLLLHGFTGSGESWATLVRRLSPAYTVITVDLPGHGRTAMATDQPIPLARYHMDSVAADLARLIEVLTAGRVEVYGYSMGGRLALYLALHYPELVSGLILESASPGLADPAARCERRQRDDALADRIEAEGVDAFVDYWEAIPLFASQARLPAEVRARLRAQRLTNRADGLANSLRGMGTGVQPSLWEALPTLRRPALLIAGALDEKYVGIARQMAALLPDSQVHIVAEAGHNVHLEQPGAVEAQVHFFYPVWSGVEGFAA